MLKKRIIPIQLLVDGRLVKTVQFDGYRDVGDPVSSSRVYSAQNADELVFLNISRNNRSIEPMFSLLEKVSEVCFMPLSLGGGITTSADAARLILHGADKVVVNSAVYDNYELIAAIAGEFGAQAVVVGIDARYNPHIGDYTLYSDCARREEAVSLDEHVDRCVAAGAGELLVTSIDRDGTMTGYDVALLRRVAERVRVPVIGAGGAGNYMHLREVFLETPVSAAACGSLFNFGDNNPIRAKAYLANYGIAYKVI